MKYAVKTKLTGVQGIFPTPFLENGDVDFRGLEQNVEKDIANGLKFLTCTGTGGEFYTLTTQEHKEVIRTVCQVINHHEDVVSVPCIGSTNLRTAIELAQTAEDAGADALLVTPPFYLPCGLEGAKAYFHELSKHTSLPFEFYFYPSLHRCELTDSQLAELLLDNDRFIAMKETSLNIETFSSIVNLVGHQVNVITGASECAVPDIYLAGGKGFVCTWTHYMPKVSLKMWETVMKGDFLKAAQMRNVLLPFLQELTKVGCIDTYKKLAMAYGYAGGPPRLPNLPLLKSEAEFEELLGMVQSIKSNPLFTDEQNQ